MSLLRTDPSVSRVRPDDCGIAAQIVAQEAAAATAQARLGNGPNKSGTCQACGNPIEKKRLAALPTARRCLGCQKALESKR